MEEKKFIKISLSTLFLIIAIIVICIMGYMMYKMNYEIKQLSEKVNNAENVTVNDKTSDIDEQKNTHNEENTNETKDEDKASIIEVTLPSGKKISVNGEYKNIFNNTEKIIIEDADKSTKKLTLDECINMIFDKYEEEVVKGKKTKISSTLFDFDKDSINEIMISLLDGEEYLLLHYNDKNIYGYVLGGYRTNGDWRINGISYFSSSAIDYGYTKYTFEGNNLKSEIIALSESDITSTGELRGMIYKIKDKVVNEDEFNKYIKEIKDNDSIEFVDYSSN